MISMFQTGDIRPHRGIKSASRTINRKKTPTLRRILNRLSGWDQKRKEREIGYLLARSGGRFTDALERRVMQREMASDWNVHW